MVNKEAAYSADPDAADMIASLVVRSPILREGLKKLLTDAGVDYLVEPDKYSGGIIFRSERVGAFFYVEEAAQRVADDVMTRNGFIPYGPAA